MENSLNFNEQDLQKNDDFNLDASKETFASLSEVDNLKSKLKKSKIKNIILSIFLCIFILIFIIVAAVTYLVYNSVKPHFRALLGKNFNLASVSQLTSDNQLDLEKFATKLAFLDDAVNILYYYDKDNKKIEDAMFTGYLNALGDNYAEYYPPKDFEEFTERNTEGVYYGIGCLVTQDKNNKDCVIETVYEDSPADKGGIKVGDVIVSINGVYVRGDDLESIIEKIRDQNEGARRDIEVYRKSEDSNITLTVYCGKVDIKLISSKIYEDNIGYLTVSEFTGKSANQFKSEIDKLLEQNIEGLIIDLRGNPGGELITVCQMMDYMIKDRDGRYTLNQKEQVFDPGKTLLVYIREKDEIVDAAYATDGHSVELPIVILTDYSTASAAELFTETLRDYKKATIVGVKTYGKGVVQNIIPYDDGSAFKFTVSEYFPPSGYSIDLKGIIPDYSLDVDGQEILYNEDNNIMIYDGDEEIVFDRNGKIISEKTIIKATESEIIDDDNLISHTDNLKIYDENNAFLNEEWFNELDNEYYDKQILQAIIILKDQLK